MDGNNQTEEKGEEDQVAENQKFTQGTHAHTTCVHNLALTY